MRSILRATAILSGGWVVSIVAGLVSAKVWALLLRPAGFGLMGLMQSLLGLLALVAGLGMGTALVQLGARSAADREYGTVSDLLRGAWLLLAAAGGIALGVLFLIPGQVSTWMLGSDRYAAALPAIGAALLLKLASEAQTGILTAFHRTSALARASMIGSVLGAVLGVGAVWAWREKGIAPALLAGAGANWLALWLQRPRELVLVAPRSEWPRALSAARRLVRFGAPYAASVMVVAGVQMVLPVMVLHLLGTAPVGLYRAATLISGNYLGFFLSAMALDYYPRLAAGRDRPPEINRMVNQQHQLAMMLAVPAVFGVLGSGPILLRLVYSAEFVPALRLLEWQMLGDLFKVATWTMSFAIMARSSKLLLGIEAVWGATVVACAWLGMRWLGLPGAGMAYVAAYVVSYLMGWILLRRQTGFRWTRTNGLLFLGAIIAAAGIVTLEPAGLGRLQVPLALVLAAATGIAGLRFALRTFSTPAPVVLEDPAGG